MAMASARTTSSGSIRMVLHTRVTTRYLNGFVPLTSMASICSVTFMLPNSAPMLEPMRPAQMSAVITGPISRTTEMETMAGSMVSAPNSANVGRDWIVRTRPMMNAVMATSGNER